MKKILTIIVLLSIFFTIGCERKPAASQAGKNLSALVFITGVIAGSPTYELLAEGALEFARTHPMVSEKYTRPE